MIPKATSAQRDFSSGELDDSAARGDDLADIRSGSRQARNWRILNSRAVKNRPGRSAVLLASGRVDEVAMLPGVVFKLAFGAGSLNIYDSTGAKVFTFTPLPWTLATVSQIVWDVYRRDIYVCFPGMRPVVVSWDGAATWSLAAYAEEQVGNQKRTPFYRISPIGVTLAPSAYQGIGITLTFSAGMNLVAGHVGTTIRYMDSQIQITAVTSPTLATGITQEVLPRAVAITFATDPNNNFKIGEAVEGQTSGTKGVVVAFPGGNVMQVQKSSLTDFVATEKIVGPNGSQGGITLLADLAAPLPITEWDDEVMNDFRGYPTTVFVDQNRVGFCNFPAVRAAIAWSAIGVPNDLFVGANPGDAIFELAPAKGQVRYVVAGPESSEFVFCDNAVYYIPISPSNPLKPGSVSFNLLTRDGCAAVQPRSVIGSVVYINAGMTSVMAVLAIGAFNRPFDVAPVSRLHAHLFNNPIALATPTSGSDFEECYTYVLNADGSLAVGKYEVENGHLKGALGWVPWSGAGTVSWVSAHASDVLLTTSYTVGGAAAVSVVEILDDTAYLDAAIPVNAVPAGIVTPGGKGPLWWLANGTVYLIDAGTRFMGIYAVDANGFIVPQNVDGEDLASATLVAGQPWTATLEPFVPAPPPGQDAQQRLRKRRISKAVIYVQNSSGFVYASRRIEPWVIGDDPAQAAPLRERAYQFRPRGRAYDPREPLLKDTPGPLTVLEIGLEATV